MPVPIPVDLRPYRSDWAEQAEQEATRLANALGNVLVAVHHIGSTAIPGIHAKPILDLLPVVVSLSIADAARPTFEGLGYAWWGEYGLLGRRFCTLDDPRTGRRKVQLHCYAQGSPEIERHLAFRDYLRERPDLADAYAAEKVRCRDLHPLDSHAYTDCKSPWIRRVEAEALHFYQAARKSETRK
jgi:GrpB-like predicted nucleotidyltransferase (UPF0157 family)